MKILWIFLACGAAVAAIVALLAYICFRIAFYAPLSKRAPAGTVNLPAGSVYGPFRESIEKWAQEVRAMPHEDVSITSFDGLTLWGRFYEYAPGAPIELMFHGYRGSAERDLAGGVQRCFQVGRSALVVDQRCGGRSDGDVITFGVREHRDCLSWVDFMLRHFGSDVKIILTGISMGAATVMIAAGKPLPPNVIGVLADCGYTSAKDIIQKVTRQIGLPPKLSYPFVRLGARIFGKFDLEEVSPVESLKNCTIPVIFFHGESDDFVPCRMSRINYDACASRKKLVTIPGAGHGLSYPVAPEAYLQALEEFFDNSAA